MSKINFIALGGVQEDGKNLYVIEVNNMIFVMDCGMKYPNQDSYGVDIIVNDLTYLSENKDRIQGLFLSHAHMDHIGGVIHLLKEKPDLRIYGSKYTMAVLGDILKDDQNVDYSKASLEVVTSKTALKFQDVTIRFFEVSHNLPESYGIALKSDDGYIIYTSNYNFDQNSHIDYAHMFRSLAVFAKEGVLALLTESLGANNEQSRGTILEFKTRIKNVFNQSNDRLIFSLFSSDILRIQQICDIAIGYGRKIAVIGRKTQKMVAQAINLGYLNIPEENFANLKFIDEKNGITNEDKNLVILVTGNRHEPFFMLQRMAKGVDRLIHLTKNDTVIVLTPPTLGTEKMASKTLDIIYHITSRVLEFNSTLLPQINANREEIKEMINILEPKYIIPVIGEYRHQYALRIVAECIGYNDEEILIPDQGDILSFQDGKYIGVTGDVPVAEVLIDGKAFKDVGEVVMRDRELLAQDGVILITANINPRTKTIILGPEVVTKGFTYTKDSESLISKIKELFYLVSEKYLCSRFINWSEYKTGLKNEISQ